ncbi:unnamed protein product [Caenorhabditis auriculariae]|uniref:Uncharacterized protein n=1 Tax=Caenorhabditis auriculariae TaxID=2777116 RepID=A0A8S1GRY9_9PELO|nr:unnamed protein product [Caenorhabditis auriculariae]
MEETSTATRALSPSSIAAEPTFSDSHENMDSSAETTSQLVESIGKEKRINRRIALATLRAAPIPKLNRNSKVMIDLTTEDDDPTNKWFVNTFASRLPAKAVKVTVKESLFDHVDAPKNVPHSIIKQKKLKKLLQEGLAKKRRAGLEKRQQQYQLDNEHLMPDEDDEEEDFKFKKTKKKVEKPMESDYDSENDEDYKEANSSNEEEDSDDDPDMKLIKNRFKINKPQRKEPESSSGDVFASPTKIAPDDGIILSMNRPNADESFDFNLYGSKPGPGSTVSNWLDNRSEMSFRHDEDENHGGFRDFAATQKAFGGDDMADILSLCSGRFGTQVKSPKNTFIDESQNLRDDFDIPDSYDRSLLESDDDEKKEIASNETDAKSKKKRLIESDDDGEEEASTSNVLLDSLPETAPLEEDEENKFAKGAHEIDEHSAETNPGNKARAVLESSDEEEGADGDDEADSDDGDDEENDEENVEDVPAPNFDDEDDELAVLKRIEYNETKRKEKKKNFFDDEASLSGDDVGSDIDEEELGVNEYEAEEGDNDDVPDFDTIRRQNHKLLMKQESDKEYRELVKLQDRLLADGDLAGTETNRQFRFRIRDELDAAMLLETNEERGNEEEEVENDDESAKAERAALLKFRIEQSESMELFLDDPAATEEDPFERAAKIVQASKSCMNLITEKPKPSLLSKSTLSSTFKETIGSSVSGPKQLYVRNHRPENDSRAQSETALNGLKRKSIVSPTGRNEVVKKARPSKLSVLEQS